MLVLQISDPHLGRTDHPTEPIAEGAEIAYDHVQSTLIEVLAGVHEPFELVITGDLSDQAYTVPGEPEHLAEAVAVLDTLPEQVPQLWAVHRLPGNHDVGNFATADTTRPITQQRLDAFLNVAGEDRFVRHHGTDGVRLIGCNSMLWGSGLRREQDQWLWLASELKAAERAGDAVAFFQHAPLFLRSPNERREPREAYWCPAPDARDRLLSLLARPHVKLIGSGHVHRWRSQDVALSPGAPPCRVVWCPGLAGTHTDAAYFPTDGDHDPAAHVVPTVRLTRDAAAFDHLLTPIATRHRWVA